MNEYACGRILPTVELSAFRDFLRHIRETEYGGRAKLQKATGVNRTTIQRIETDPTYSPGLETIAKLVEGMGLSLSVFFARFENHTGANRGLIRGTASVQNPPLPYVYEPGAKNVDRSVPPSSTPPYTYTEEEILHLFRIFKAARGGTIAGAMPSGKQARKQAPDHRARKPKGRKTS